jgi:hypothetical protein
MLLKDELKKALDSRGGHTIASVIMCTPPSNMRKTGNPFRDSKVLKVTKAQVMIGHDYEKMVINRSAKVNGTVSDFEAEKMSGKVWEIPNLIERSITNPDQRYLRLYFNAKSNTEISFLIDGVEATPEQTETIKSFIPERAISEKQKEEADLDTLKDQIIISSPKVENLRSLKFSGQEFVV